MMLKEIMSKGDKSSAKESYVQISKKAQIDFFKLEIFKFTKNTDTIILRTILIEINQYYLIQSC